MIRFNGQAVLLDIEGTTSSVSFVYDQMFPFARRELAAFLELNWQDSQVQRAADLIARDAGHASLSAWCGDQIPNRQLELVRDEVVRLMDGDVKATGLKQLQGLIWKRGFESGELQAHLFEEVAENLRRWHAAGIDIRIYSSGSVQAQKLFFGHTIEGDLLSLFRGHYDTTIGSKREASSYSAIASDAQIPPQEILFLSDIPAELDAALEAGLQTALCQRPGNAAVNPDHGHDVIDNFSEVEWPSGMPSSR
ncbi:MAG: acireductone synthase [Planctomycetaceae bacterium]|nr:acireductone synthase [Planctomycetaceae bacterium]